METKDRNDLPDAPDPVREVPKWVSRYAHNRTLPILVNLALFVAGWAAIAGSSTLANRALHAGHKVAAYVFGIAALAAGALWVWLVATQRLERLSGALSVRLYGAEGTAVATSGGHSRADLVVGLAFGLCVTLTVGAGFAFAAASRYLVPIMATYSIPFLLYIWVRQGGMAAPFMLLWPGLFAIHAALALAGVGPFGGEPNALTIMVPTIGYGAVAALASHVYSRAALRRLRRLARSPETVGKGGE